MDWIDRWEEVLQTLSRNRLRTALTALSVGWGVFMLALSKECDLSKVGVGQPSGYRRGGRVDQNSDQHHPGIEIGSQQRLDFDGTGVHNDTFDTDFEDNAAQQMHDGVANAGCAPGQRRVELQPEDLVVIGEHRRLEQVALRVEHLDSGDVLYQSVGDNNLSMSIEESWFYEDGGDYEVTVWSEGGADCGQRYLLALELLD